MNYDIKNNIKILTPYLNRCYSPYSKFNVASMLVLDNNETYFGVNVENCSYSLTNCAEKNCISSAITNNASLENAKYLLVITNSAQDITPCGACRQILAEFFKPDFNIYTSAGNLSEYKTYKLQQLLPNTFIK